MVKANAVDFIRESAAFLVDDRPDLYNPEVAVHEITQAMEDLRGTSKTVAFVSFTSYVLCRIWEDGVEEFILSRKISGLLICMEEQDVRAYSYGLAEGLPFVGEDPEGDLDNDDFGVVE